MVGRQAFPFGMIHFWGDELLNFQGVNHPISTKLSTAPSVALAFVPGSQWKRHGGKDMA